jgi:hypothetical protein
MGTMNTSSAPVFTSLHTSVDATGVYTYLCNDASALPVGGEEARVLQLLANAGLVPNAVERQVLQTA